MSRYLVDGLNCLHYHKVKQEELCILLRSYHSPDELYTLLKSVVGNSDNFKDFVLQYYKRVSSVSGFAALANMSLRNFQRRFKTEFKCSAQQWLTDRRAEHILLDIRSTDKELAEIAVDYGFATPSYFTLFCKRYFGKTPSALRRQFYDKITNGPRTAEAPRAAVSGIPEGGGSAPLHCRKKPRRGRRAEEDAAMIFPPAEHDEF